MTKFKKIFSKIAVIILWLILISLVCAMTYGGMYLAIHCDRINESDHYETTL